MSVAAGATAVLFVAIVWKVRQLIQGYWFDARCPASCASKDLTGRVALVTGATTGGLGCAAAELLAERGARVIITCRSGPKGAAAAKRVALASPAGANGVSVLLVDFSSRSSILKAAAKFEEDVGQLDILVLNAGVSSGNTEAMWQTNHVGPFAFTERLRPLLTKAARKNGDARVVAVSSGAHQHSAICHKDPYQGGGYGQSKLAQIMHMRELQRSLREASPSVPVKAFRCFAITPGFVSTGLLGAALEELALPLRFAANSAMACLGPLLARSPRVGAQTILRACLDDDLDGGEYLSNCYVKPAKGRDGCANDEAAWRKCWELSERCAEDGKF